MVMIDLITGFLGSGKTTFLKKYAEYLMDQGLHIGILENDFGAINVDMLMLHELRGDQCELEMIAGGCDAESRLLSGSSNSGRKYEPAYLLCSENSGHNIG